MLPLDEWLPQAQQLREGESRRVDHVCGGGATLKIGHEADRWHAWCFRCSDGGIEDKPKESWQARLDRLAKERDHDDTIEASVQLPSPANFDVTSWPAPARVWLYKAGIGLPEIAQLGAYWHEPSARVVLPVFEGDEVRYWQARDPEWTRKSKRAKYINPSVDKRDVLPKYGEGDLLVLCEDILSAFRVGQLTEAWAMMGTDFPAHIAAQIQPGRKVAVMLDPDAAGRGAGRDIVNQLQLMGHPAQRVELRADPKLLSRRELQQWINSTLQSLS